MPSAATVREMRTGQDHVSALARRDLRAFWATLDTSNMIAVRNNLREFYPALIRTYGEVAATAAVEWYENTYRERAKLVTDVAADDAVIARMQWAITEGFHGNPSQALSTMNVLTDELVKQPGRDSIMQSAADHDRRFARIPTSSKPCGFCLTLASRGFVYRSEESAGGIDKYHGDCGCEVVPDDGEVPEGYDEEALYDQYESVHEPGDTINDVTRKLRKKYGTS